MDPEISQNKEPEPGQMRPFKPLERAEHELLMALSEPEFRRHAANALVICDAAQIKSMGRAWAQRSLPMADIDQACHDAGFGMGFVDYCQGLKYGQAVDDMLSSGLACWEKTRACAVLAEHAAVGLGEMPLGQASAGPMQASVSGWVARIWAKHAQEAAEGRSRSEPRAPKTLGDYDCDYAESLLRRFSRRQLGFKERLIEHARVAIEGLDGQYAAQDMGSQEPPKSAQKALNKLAQAFDIVGIGAQLAEPLAALGARMASRSKEFAKVIPWSLAFDGALRTDSVEVLRALVDGASKIGLKVLGPEVIKYVDYPTGEIESGRGCLGSWMDVAIGKSAWGCVRELALMGASTGMIPPEARRDPNMQRNVFEGFARADMAEQGAREALIEVSHAVAAQALGQGWAKDPQDAAHWVELATGRASAKAANKKSKDYVHWESALIHQSTWLNEWARGAAELKSCKQAPRL
jgi:hypothetical protein